MAASDRRSLPVVDANCRAAPLLLSVSKIEEAVSLGQLF